MRLALLLLIGLTAAATPNTARADQYRWCAMYSGDEGAGTNCYFVTLEQCRATVSGVGGFCAPSPFAGNAPAPTPAQSRKKS